MILLFWVGKYESDIAHDCIFSGSITYYGSNKCNNYAFCKDGLRISSLQKDGFQNFVIKMIERKISEDSNSKFMFYNQSLALEIAALHPEYAPHFLGLNESSIIDTLNNKLYNRLWFSSIINTIPVRLFNKNECSFKNVQSFFPEYSQFIVQKNISSGGKGTFILSQETDTKISSELEDMELYIVSPFISESFPVNMHVCITDTDVIKFPISLQINQLIDNKLLFCGSDYIAPKYISKEIKKQINSNIEKICSLLKMYGYRGVLGIDLLVSKNKIYFIEVNPRFQGSTLPLNKGLIDNNLPSLYQMHLEAFQDGIAVEIKEKIENININYSILIYKHFSYSDYIPELYLLMKNSKEPFDIYEDGYQTSINMDYSAYIFRVLIKKNISYVNPDNNVNLIENLMNIKHLDFPIKNSDEIITLKISLLVQGVRLSKDAHNYISQENTIKDATFNAIDISIFDGLKINCPQNISFSDLSPYHIEYDTLNGLQLYYKHSFISNVKVDTNENILDRKTSSGIPYSGIGFKTNDRVRIRHTDICYYKKQGQSCSFCESKHTKQYHLSDSDIYEVIDAYEKEIDFRHYLIGGASEQMELEPEQIKKIIQYIRKKSKKPIYLMSLPPRDVKHIYDYYQLGLNEVAFNIEIYDRKIASEIMPGKGKIPISTYMNALEESTKYFGKTGNVRSMLIVGLEPEESLLNGIKALCAIGVSPMLSIYRPMPLTPMKHIVPPIITDIKSIYWKCENICKQHGLQLGPLCDQCQNNTLSLPSYYSTIA